MDRKKRLEELCRKIFQENSADVRVGYRVDGEIEKLQFLADKATELVEIGSASKMFTSVGLFILKDRGQISLDSKIGDYLSDSIVSALKTETIDYTQATLREILSHKGGFGDHLNSGDAEKVLEFCAAKDNFTLEECIQLSKENKLNSYIKIGEKFQYSNIGYILLGEVFRKVTGENFREFIRKNIFVPLKMEKTYFIGENVKKPLKNPGSYKGKNYPMPAEIAGAAGEIESTIEDMIRFLIGFKSLITKESFEEILQSTTGPDFGYGFYKDKDFIGHGGQTFSYLTRAFFKPSNGEYYVVSISRADLSAELKEIVSLINE